MKNNKLLLAIIAILLIFAILLGVYFGVTAKTKGKKSITLQIEIEGNIQEFKTKTEGLVVLDVLKELQDRKKLTFSGDDSGYGLYLTEINGRVADESSHEFYSLYINGDFASFGVSEQPINDGDVIKISLQTW